MYPLRAKMLLMVTSLNNPARVFFALWPNAVERNQLAAWQIPLKSLCGGRVMRADTLHNTLIFIGDIQSDRLALLRQTAEKTDIPGFDLNFDQVRYWNHNHIVYATPSSVPENLTKLVGTLATNLSAQGFKFDRREYCPHVTLLRNAHFNAESLPVLTPVQWKIREFALVQSLHREEKTDYPILARFPLKPSHMRQKC
jgi:2'-5' RNA ligase